MFARTSTTESKDESICNVFERLFHGNITFFIKFNINGSNSMHAMFERYRGFVSFLTQNVPVVFAVHGAKYLSDINAVNNEKLIAPSH